MSSPLQPGIQFSTLCESGCVVLTTPDDFGAFTALDSDGVECSFGVAMVVTIDTDKAGNYGPVPFVQEGS